MMKRVNLIIVLIFLSLSFISSTTCDITSITKSINIGEIPSSSTFTCSNNVNYNVSLFKYGNFFTDTNSIILQNNSAKSITLNFVQMNSAGNFSGSLFSSDGLTIPISINVNEIITTGCQLNPSLASYTQAVQQGTTIPLPKITFSPKNCVGSMVFDNSNIYIEGGIISDSIRKPITITSIVSDGINLEINTDGLNSQTYSSKLKVNAFEKIFEIPFTIIVTAGSSAVTNFSVNNLPTCSLNSNTLNINETYSLVCSNLQPDVSIHPVIDNEYVYGTGQDSSSNQYVWYFKPKKMGNTFIKAEFSYLNSPVGNPFSQEVKITSTSSSVSGTSLKLLFTPSLDVLSNNQESIIQLVDNKTGSLVDNPEIYINAIKLNSLNNSEKSFPYTLEVGKNYDIRGKAVGYYDLVETINITSKEIKITITPEKSEYDAGEKVNITTDINATIYINDISIIPNDYSLPSGNVVIKAEKSGYLTTNKTINVLSSVYLDLGSCTTEIDKWKKGKEVTCSISKESEWVVYLNSSIINSGNGTAVTFKPDDYGILEVKADGISVVTKDLEKSSLWETIKGLGWWWVLISLVLMVLIYLFLARDDSEEETLGDIYSGT